MRATIQRSKTGVRVLTYRIPHLQSVTVLSMVGVGSRFESLEKAGISHFLEHLPFKGTKSYPSSLELAEAIDRVGGKHNAFTSKEYTGYWVKVAASKLDLAVDVVSDLLFSALLRPEDIEKEKDVIVEEINMYEDNPRAKVSMNYDRLVFSGSQLAVDIAGSIETVRAMQAQDFQDHWQRWYTPDNIVFAVVGGYETSDAELLEVIESGLQKQPAAKQLSPEKKDPVQVQTQVRVQVEQRETEQAHFYMGVPSLARSDDRKAIQTVLAMMLGGNSSSQLFNEIREKRGLAYYAYAGADFYQDSGTLYAFEGVNTDKIFDAISVTKQEMMAFTSMGEEKRKLFEQAKSCIIGKTALEVESSSTLANIFVRQELLSQENKSIDEMLDEIRVVEFDQVRALAAELFQEDKFNLAVIGPYEDESLFTDMFS